MENVQSGLEFEITMSLGPLTSGFYHVEKSIHSDPAVVTYSKMFKSVIVKSISLHCMQLDLTDRDEKDGPKPKGYVRFGVIPEDVLPRTNQDFEAMKCIPHLYELMLGGEQQCQTSKSASDLVMSTMELDLAITPRRPARPQLVIVNCGFTSTKTGGKEKESSIAWNLAILSANVRVVCSGQAFGA